MAGYPQIAIGEWTQVGEGYNAPDFIAFLKSWISRALETV